MIPAYIAGLIDGEGCIAVGHHKKTDTYQIRVYVGMTEPAKSLLERLKTIYGGSVKLFRAGTDRWANAYIWTISGAKAYECLLSITDHLCVKQKQAQLALFLHEKIQACGWNEETREIAAIVKMEMSDLNRKGPELQMTPPTPKAVLHARIAADMLLQPRAPDIFNPTEWEPSCKSFPESGIVEHGLVWTPGTLVSHSADDAYSECSLSSVLETETDWLARNPGKTTDDWQAYIMKYYLSKRACAGILRRAERRGKKLPERLEAVLRRVAGLTTPTG